MGFAHTVAEVIIAACLVASGTSSQARSQHAQMRHEVPPAPAPTYDPQPGPFLAVVNEQGALEDVGAIANATRSWAGPTLSAFSLCFHPASKPLNWTLASSALRNVARDLRAQGAAIIIVDAVRLCTSPSKMSRSYVEITGVIRG